MRSKIEETYREKREYFSREFFKMKKQGNLLSLSRLIVFITGFFFIYYTAGIHPMLAITVFLLSFILFLFLVKLHGQTDLSAQKLSELIKLNENEILALKGDINHFENGSEFISRDHPYTFDLDVFGDGSLFQYLNRTCTYGGKKNLKNWLCGPLEDKLQIGFRQDAIRELSKNLDWRQNFLATGYLYNESVEQEQGILKWVSKESEFKNLKSYRIIRFILPAITILLLSLSIARILPASVAISMILIQFFVIAVNLTAVNRIHRQVARQFAMLQKFGRLLSLIEEEKFTSGYLIDLQGRLSQNGITAAAQLKKLAKITHRFDRRLDMLIGIILNGLFLWDIHCVFELEKWRERYNDRILYWFSVIADLDVLISLSGFCYNNPDYCFPQVIGDGTILNAKKLGHPLIHEDARVANDFSMKDRGSLVIITGPNMAGKSTFLRTIGVNLILAMAGAPVCAELFHFFPVRIYSSMRTIDSLMKNESYFYAELSRLKILKEKLVNDKNVFILLDEILKGTNSVDKHAGSKLFIEQLIRWNGMGLIATHDVRLGEMESDYSDNIMNKCFEVEIDGDEILFDYVLREGITSKMNAAYLMKQMGII